MQYDATTDGSVEDDFTSGYDVITNFLVTGDAGAVDQFDLDGFTAVDQVDDGTFEAVNKNAIAEDKAVSYLNPASATADDLTSDADVTAALGTLAGNVVTGDKMVFIVSKTDGSAFGLYGFTADATDTTIATSELSLLAIVNTAATGFDIDNIVQ